MNFSLRITLWLGILGFTVYAAGLWHVLTPQVALILTCLLVIKIIWIIKQNSFVLPHLTRLEIILSLMFSLVIATNALGILVPETSFDALWYHLPEATIYAQTGTIAKIPELLYSTMPRLGEMYFTLALFTHSLLAVKTVTFAFYLLFLALSCTLSLQILSRPQSLLAAFILAALPLTSWQSTAAYVDLILADFILAAVICLIKVQNHSPPAGRLFRDRHLWYFALFLGFSLSVKMQAVIYVIPLLLIMLALFLHQYLHVKHAITLGIWLLVLTAVPTVPWYLDNYLESGSPIYPLNLPAKRLDQLTHAGIASLPDWLLHQTLTIPLIPWDLGTNYNYQLTPLITILFPLFLLQIKSYKKLWPLTSYLFMTLVLWWYLPPPETRYLLGAIPPFIILLMYSVTTLSSDLHTIKNVALFSVFLSLFVTIGIRLVATYKYLPLLTGKITSTQYLTTQTTDFNRSIIEKYYSGYWQTYQYP